MRNKDRQLVLRGVGRSVRAEAARRGVRQQDIASRLGLSQGSISTRFAGQVAFTADELAEIAAWFEVPVARFFEPLPAKPQGVRNG